jgi:hypothetical protein
MICFYADERGSDSKLGNISFGNNWLLLREKEQEPFVSRSVEITVRDNRDFQRRRS